MAGPRFKSNRREFSRKNNSFVEMVKARMTQDIEVIIKTGGRTPVKTGGMKAEVRHFKNDRGGYRVEAGKEYSAPQEQGQRLSGKGAPTAKFRNYTTPGTGAGWFRDAIARVLRARDNYISEAKRAVGL